MKHAGVLFLVVPCLVRHHHMPFVMRLGWLHSWVLRAGFSLKEAPAHDVCSSTQNKGTKGLRLWHPFILDLGWIPGLETRTLAIVCTTEIFSISYCLPIPLLDLGPSSQVKGYAYSQGAPLPCYWTSSALTQGVCDPPQRHERIQHYLTNGMGRFELD